VVFLAYNRREDLRRSLIATIEESEYPQSRLDVIVVDNASTDGTAEMLERDFGSVQVIRRPHNSGVSGWNDGFAAASGRYVLALDDDCRLPAAGLRRAVSEAERHDADLVSFGVVSSVQEDYRFDRAEHRTGLLSFWGCAALFRREALQALGGYDPAIFIWGNELELMLRFYDRGFRHLHLPEVVAVHAKAPSAWAGGSIPARAYRANARNFGYISGKLLARRDAAGALVALLARNLSDALRKDAGALKAIPHTLGGFAQGLRRRRPVRASVSGVYRRNFETFASPWWVERSFRELVSDTLAPRRTGTAPSDRRDAWLARRPSFYPERSGVLEL